METPAIIKAIIGYPRGRLGVAAAGTCMVVDKPSDVVTCVFRMDGPPMLTGPVASGVLRPPARSGAGVIIVMYKHSHRPLLPQGLSLNLAVGVNVAVDDLDHFAGQTDDPLDGKLLPIAGTMKGDDLPTPWPPHLKGRAVDQDPIAGQHPGSRRQCEFGGTIRANG